MICKYKYIYINIYILKHKLEFLIYIVYNKRDPIFEIDSDDYRSFLNMINEFSNEQRLKLFSVYIDTLEKSEFDKIFMTKNQR